MIRQLCVRFCLALLTTAIPLQAAKRPHAGTVSQKIKVWTNADLEKLHDLGLISIVGPTYEETSRSEPAPKDHEITQDAKWYAEQAARLRDELRYRNEQLREYKQALDDARSLRKTTSGINLDEGHIGITPDAGIELLWRRVKEKQSELDALEDLARHSDIEPGALRGQ